jgi:DNA-binding transcriptional LysR family regulator
MHQMISLGPGICILPDYLGDSDLKLVSLFALLEETNKDVWLLAHSDLRSISMRWRRKPNWGPLISYQS